MLAGGIFLSSYKTKLITHLLMVCDSRSCSDMLTECMAKRRTKPKRAEKEQRSMETATINEKRSATADDAAHDAKKEKKESSA